MALFPDAETASKEAYLARQTTILKPINRALFMQAWSSLGSVRLLWLAG